MISPTYLMYLVNRLFNTGERQNLTRGPGSKSWRVTVGLVWDLKLRCPWGPGTRGAHAQSARKGAASPWPHTAAAVQDQRKDGVWTSLWLSEVLTVGN